jgi:hypothetical protein
MKSIIRKWCDIIFINKKIERLKNICANKNINSHNYIINRHNFDPKPDCDLQTHLCKNFHAHK